MKRIIALVLVAIMSLAFLVGCQSAVGEIDNIKTCYAASYPHKIVVESTQQFGSQTLVSTTTLIRGSIGNDFAAKMIVDGEQLRSIEDGSGTTVYGPVEVLDTEAWYRFGKGVSTDKGSKWDDAGENFFPDKGDLALNLDPALMTGATYEGNTLSFTVAAAKTAEFFGADGKVDADVNVSITIGGGFVTNVVISWSIPANFATGVDTMNVTIESTYIYDQQRISFD